QVLVGAVGEGAGDDAVLADGNLAQVTHGITVLSHRGGRGGGTELGQAGEVAGTAHMQIDLDVRGPVARIEFHLRTAVIEGEGRDRAVLAEIELALGALDDVLLARELDLPQPLTGRGGWDHAHGGNMFLADGIVYGDGAFGDLG